MIEYVERRADGRWKKVVKSTQLKNTGWERSKARPWFMSTTWKGTDISRVNQVLSGHFPTLEYLKSRGREISSDLYRQCGKQTETHDHLLQCETLREKRRQLFYQDDPQAEELVWFKDHSNTTSQGTANTSFKQSGEKKIGQVTRKEP